MQTSFTTDNELPDGIAPGPVQNSDSGAEGRGPESLKKPPAVLRKPLWVLLLVFSLALLVDRIVFYRQPGAQWAIAVNLLLAVLFLSAALEHKRVPLSSMLLALLTGASAVLTMFRAEGFTTAALVLFSLLGTVLLAVSFLNGQGFVYRLREYVTQGLRLAASALVGLPAGLIQSAQRGKESQGAEPSSRGGLRSGAVLRGILIALPLVALLGLLLASADAVFSSRLSALLEWIKIERPEEFVFRGLFVLGLSYCLFGLVWHALTRTEERLPLEPDQPLIKPFLGMTESAIILAALNLLFSILATLLLLQTGVVLLSAFQRLSLYEAAYGFTQARLTAHVFMIFLGLILAISAALEITRSYKYLAAVLLILVLAFGLTLAFLNVDRTIARQNLAHAQAGNTLDLAYLAGTALSEDATPELFASFDDPALTPELKDALGLALSCRAARFAQNNPDSPFWASWHASRAAGGRLYQSRADALAAYPLQDFPEGRGILIEAQPFICAFTDSAR